MVKLVVTNLVKSFGSFSGVDNVSFEVAEGEFLTLLGPSGCGKSTTLAAIAGLDRPTSGRIVAGSTTFFDGTQGTYLAAEKRNCGLVFQSYALWPHMTVAGNVAFPLELRKTNRREIDSRVEEVLALVELEAMAGRYPHQLSGGQQQRVALARTLVYRPSILLLDEPLSNLDAKLRERARTWLRAVQERVQLTTIYVTHDQGEALALSDRIAVMSKGKIAQIGTPREIYNNPATPDVAQFVGTSSFVEGTTANSASRGEAVEVALQRGGTILATTRQALAGASAVVVAMRPERLALIGQGDQQPSGVGSFNDVNITSRTYLGATVQYTVELAGVEIKVETLREFSDDGLRLWIPASACTVFDRGEI